MYRLEKMEIHGFKSFYDRTEIVLPERTTAVVGPNGCGKSNISDAIHWVLGEQRVHTLRGEKMEDVIFNGSEKRKPLGMAEVSLFMARTHGANGNGSHPDGAFEAPEIVVPTPDGGLLLPPVEGQPGESGAIIEAADRGNGDAPMPGNGDDSWPEAIRITRRLFRDGQSEYLIDGVRRRLRDVKDLLQRLSVGSGASSIIEQGKVEQIVASKPRERRVLIEEAAGIAGFKAKKREATLKLEATEANLARLEDIIVEVRRQISSTKRQAAKARRYRRLMEERRRLERISYHQRTLDLDGRLGTLRQDRDAVQNREAEVSAGHARAQAESERLRAVVEEGDRALTVARERLHALDLQIDREERGQAAACKQADEQIEAATAAERESEDLTRQSQETAVELEGREAEGLALGVELRRLATQGEAVELRGQEMRRGIDELEAALEESRRELFVRLDRVSELRTERSRLEEDRRRAAGAVERADREAGEAAQEGAVLGAEAAAIETELAEASRRASELQETAASAAGRAASARERLAVVERGGERTRQECRSLSERLGALQARDRDESAQGRAARAAASDAQGVVADQVRPDAELEPVAESYLGDLLPAAIVDGEDAARRAVDRLESAEQGRASFLIASAPSPEPSDLPADLAGHPKVRGKLADLLHVHGAAQSAVRAAADRAVVVDDLDTALQLARVHPDRAFLTVAGQIVRPGGLVTAGRSAGGEDGILVLRRSIVSLSEELERSETASRAASESTDTLRREIEAAETEGGNAQRERAEIEVSVAELRERLRALAERRQRSDRAQQVRRAEAERARADHVAWSEDLSRAEAELASAERTRDEQQAAIRGRSEQLASRREELAAAMEEGADLKSRVEGARTRLEALGEDVARLGRTVHELGARAARYREEAESRRRRAGDLRELAGRAEESLKRNLERRSVEKTRVDGDAEVLEERRARSAERADEARTLGASLEEIRGQRVEVEVGVSRAESERDFLEQSCRNDLDQTLAEATAALAEGEEETPAETVQQGLEAIRGRIDAIGPVNVMAEDEFTEIEQRYDFLTSQQKDLQDSVRSLRETISRVNRRSRDRFQTAFEQIRKNFQETYRILFGGGRADLQLEEDVQDVLECGVEITAQPPGKRLQRIGLLSGGEKALTAIALLFAIFRYRPSPFCILDEVDAPLDEANIGRYTELLRRMAAETQFVVITHNKRTMERSDILYGVTMDEPGVSRLVSVRFESDGRLAAEDGSGELRLDRPKPRASRPDAALQPGA